MPYLDKQVDILTRFGRVVDTESNDRFFFQQVSRASIQRLNHRRILRRVWVSFQDLNQCAGLLKIVTKNEFKYFLYEESKRRPDTVAQGLKIESKFKPLVWSQSQIHSLEVWVTHHCWGSKPLMTSLSQIPGVSGLCQRHQWPSPSHVTGPGHKWCSLDPNPCLWSHDLIMSTLTHLAPPTCHYDCLIFQLGGQVCLWK